MVILLVMTVHSTSVSYDCRNGLCKRTDIDPYELNVLSITAYVNKTKPIFDVDAFRIYNRVSRRGNFSLDISVKIISKVALHKNIFILGLISISLSEFWGWGYMLLPLRSNPSITRLPIKHFSHRTVLHLQYSMEKSYIRYVNPNLKHMKDVDSKFTVPGRVTANIRINLRETITYSNGTQNTYQLF